MVDQVSYSLREDGFEIRKTQLEPSDLVSLRNEADRVSHEAGSNCVRQLLLKSDFFLSTISVVAEDLPELEGMQPVRSLLFDKTPERNWPVALHRDTTITVQQRKAAPGYGRWTSKEGVVHVKPPDNLLESMVTIRLHLDDTPEENGALIVQPQSHLSARESSDEYVCECKAGEVLLMKPLLLHSSRRSERPSRRRVIHVEFAHRSELDPQLEWAE